MTAPDLYIQLTLNTSWGTIKTCCTGIGRIRPLRLNKGDFIPIRLRRQDLRMAGSHQTSIEISGFRTFTFPHLMQMPAGIHLSGWIRLDANVNELGSEPTSIQATFVRGCFSIPTSGFTIQGLGYADPGHLILTPEDWYLSVDRSKPVFGDQSLALKLRPQFAEAGDPQATQFSVVNNDEIFRILLNFIKLRLAVFGFMATASNETPGIVFRSNGNLHDSHLLILSNGLLLQTKLSGHLWSPAYVSFRLADGALKLGTSPSVFSIKPAKITLKRNPGHQLLWSFEPFGRTLLLVGAQDCQYPPRQFVHGQWLWSYVQIKTPLETPNRSNWLRWPLIPCAELPKAGGQAEPRLELNTSDFYRHDDVGLSISSCSFGANQGLILKLLNQDTLEIFAESVDVDLSVAGLRLLPVASAEDLSSWNPEAAPATLFPSRDVRPASLLFRAVPARTGDQSPRQIQLKPNPDNSELSATSDSILIDGTLHLLAEHDPKIATLSLPSATVANPSAWDPNQGQALAALKNPTLSLTSLEFTDSSVAASGPSVLVMRALLPWVEHKDGKDFLYHYNLVCDFDDAWLSLADSASNPAKALTSSSTFNLGLIHDVFSLAAKINDNPGTLDSQNWWPNLKYDGNDPLYLRQKVVLNNRSSGEIVLPVLQRGGYSLSLDSSLGDPPWLDATVIVQSEDCPGCLPSFTAEIVNYNPAGICLSADLLVARDYTLDHAGVRRGPYQAITFTDTALPLHIQPLIAFDQQASLFRINGTLAIALPDSGCSLHIHFSDFLVVYDSADSCFCSWDSHSSPSTATREHLLCQGTATLSDPGISGCPVVLTNFISLHVEADTTPGLFKAWQRLTFDGVITLLRPSGSDSQSASIQTPARFSITSDSQISITSISSSAAASNRLILNPSAAQVARFPHGSIAAPITQLSGCLELKDKRLWLKSIEASVEFMGQPRKVNTFPDLFTADGFLWTSDINGANSDCNSIHRPLWSWPHVESEISTATHRQSAWQWIAYRSTALAQPSDYQLSLGGMLWLDRLSCQFHFYRFFDPELPTLYVPCPRHEPLAWDLLSTDCPESGSEGDSQRFLAVCCQNDDQPCSLVVIDAAGVISQPLPIGTGPGTPSVPPLVRWLNSPDHLAIISESMLYIILLDRTAGLNLKRLLQIELPSPASADQIPHLAKAIQPLWFDPREGGMTLFVIYGPSAFTISFQLPRPASAPLATQPKLLELPALASADLTCCLTNRLAVRVPQTGWFFLHQSGADDSPAIQPLPHSESMKAIVEHHGFLYAAQLSTDSRSSLIYRRPELTPAEPAWVHVTTLPVVVDSGMSTPLGPWWLSQQAIYGMDGVVEWDLQGLRAQLCFECPLALGCPPAPSVVPGSAAPQWLWRTTWGQSAWLQLYEQEPAPLTSNPPVEAPLRLALARDVQEGQIAFTIPDFQPASQLHLSPKPWIWCSGALLLWPDSSPASTGPSRLGGALLTEGVCAWQNLGVSIQGFPVPDSQPILAHCFLIGWSHADRWHGERRITAALPGPDGWTLQLHEQNLNSSQPCMGLLIHTSGDPIVVDCQLPVMLTPSSIEPHYGDVRFAISPGLYRLNDYSLSITGSLPNSEAQQAYDFCLHRVEPQPLDHSRSIGVDFYNVEPLPQSSPEPPQWMTLSVVSGKPELHSLPVEVVPHLLNHGLDVSAPKQSIRELQFGHRRVFGARLRFDPDNLVVIPPESALLRQQAYTYYASDNQSSSSLDEDNPVFGDAVVSLMHPGATSIEWSKFSEYWLSHAGNGEYQVWNSGHEGDTIHGWRSISDPTDYDLWKGDCIVSWTERDPASPDFGPPGEDPSFQPRPNSRMTGALLCRSGSSLVLLHEPFWQVKQTPQSPPAWRSENLLLLGRCPLVTSPTSPAVPVLACLRSVTDLVQAESSLRGLSEDEARAWLLDHGSQGFPLRRVCFSEGPSRYQFLRSPFSLAGQDQDVDAQPAPPTGASDASPAGLMDDHSSAPLPKHLPLYFQPVSCTADPTLAPAPRFRSPQRRARFKLTSLAASNSAPDPSSDAAAIQTVLLHEAVAYPNRVHNRVLFPSCQPDTTTSGQIDAHSFFPDVLDLAYGTDKPGAMILHALTPMQAFASSPAVDRWGKGPLTEFLMRDPRHDQPPEQSSLVIHSFAFCLDPDSLADCAELVFDDVLGCVLPPEGLLFQCSDPQPEASQPPFIFTPGAITIVSLVGDQIFVADRQSDFVPCSESRQVYILCPVEQLPFLETCTLDCNGTKYKFSFHGLHIALPLPSVESQQDADVVVIPATIPASDNAAGGTTVPSLKLYWTVSPVSESDPSQDFFCGYFNNNNETWVESDSALRGLPIRVMPSLVTPKVSVVLQRAQSGESPSIIKESTALFGSLRSSALFFSPQRSDRSLEVRSRYSVKWELRDPSWKSSQHNPDPSNTSLIVVKYFPDGASIFACKQVIP